MASTENPISSPEELHVEMDHSSGPSANASPAAVNGHKAEDVEPGLPTIEISENKEGSLEEKEQKIPPEENRNSSEDKENESSGDVEEKTPQEVPRQKNDSEEEGDASEQGSPKQTPPNKNESSQCTENGSSSAVNTALSDSKIKKARNKFEQQGSFDKKGGKRKEKVKYAGLSSAKNRFMDAAAADERQTQEKRKPKRITPPRDGNLTGVVENQPAERDPNVVRSDAIDMEEVPKPASAKNALARFREMEKGGASEARRTSAGKAEVDAEVTKNLMNVWKTRETNPEPENKERKSQIKIREEVEGGVYENQPTVLEDVVRCGDQPPEQLLEGVDTRTLRQRFLAQANEAASTKKHNALEEISELAKREQNVVFENQPEAPTEGVIRAAYEDDRQAVAINTKELKERFLRGEQKSDAPKKPINIKEGEGGVYENAPEERDDVVRSSGHQVLNPLEEVGHWASEAKMRFMEDANRLTGSINRDGKRPVQLDLAEGGVFENEPIRREDVVRAGQEEEEPMLSENTVKSSLQRLQEIKEQASKVKTSQAPVTLAESEAGAGVFENVPASSQADYKAAAMLEAEAKMEGKYASEAKKLFLQRQEEAKRQKEAPKMIDIWSDLCKDSGVFENRPRERDPNIVREYEDDDDDDEEEEEEEEEEVEEK